MAMQCRADLTLLHIEEVDRFASITSQNAPIWTPSEAFALKFGERVQQLSTRLALVVLHSPQLDCTIAGIQVRTGQGCAGRIKGQMPNPAVRLHREDLDVG